MPCFLARRSNRPPPMRLNQGRPIRASLLPSLRRVNTCLRRATEKTNVESWKTGIPPEATKDKLRCLSVHQTNIRGTRGIRGSRKKTGEKRSCLFSRVVRVFGGSRKEVFAAREPLPRSQVVCGAPGPPRPSPAPRRLFLLSSFPHSSAGLVSLQSQSTSH